MTSNASAAENDNEFFPAVPERSAAATRLLHVGQTIFGHRFHAALANELDVSRPLLVAMINDQRRVTPAVERRLADVIRSSIVPQLEVKIETLVSFADAIDMKLLAYAPPQSSVR